jgi:MYXO-CTERM domain-containing protein
MDQVCEAGACVSACSCQACKGGLACGKDGHCGDPKCLNMMCQKGQFCANGNCEDSCMGAVCPAGQACMMGDCVPYTPPDMSEVEDLSPIFLEGDEFGVPGGDRKGLHQSGCACAVGSARDGGGAGGLLACVAIGLALVVRRRRR